MMNEERAKAENKRALSKAWWGRGIITSVGDSRQRRSRVGLRSVLTGKGKGVVRESEKAGKREGYMRRSMRRVPGSPTSQS